MFKDAILILFEIMGLWFLVAIAQINLWPISWIWVLRAIVAVLTILAIPVFYISLKEEIDSKRGIKEIEPV